MTLSYQLVTNDGTCIDITNDRFLIGSGQNNHIVVQNADLAANHALIAISNDRIFVVDFSQTGIFVNGKRVQKQCELHSNDTLTMGKISFRLIASTPKITKQKKWDVIAPIALLLFVAFVIFIASNSKSSQQTTISSTKDASSVSTATEAIPTRSVPPPTPIFISDSIDYSEPVTYTISYAGASDWLTDLPVEDHNDQIRDWAAYGLVGLLDLNLKTVTEISYDKSPVRDGIFLGITNMAIGPGRGFPDYQGVFHILIPNNDPYSNRTIGLLLDDYRKNAGSDPDLVIIYNYQIETESKTVILTSNPPKQTASVRDENGYVQRAVNTLDELESFLGSIEHLSQVKVVNDQLWVSGWHWPNTPTGQITSQDISSLVYGYKNALASDYTPEDQDKLLDQYLHEVEIGSISEQKAYQLFEIDKRHRQSAASEPGFSLDSGVLLSPQDTLALLASSRKYPTISMELSQLQALFDAWDDAKIPSERTNAAYSLLEKYYDLSDTNEDSADVFISLFDGRVFLEIALDYYPALDPYASDLRSSFAVIYDNNASSTQKNQAIQDTTELLYKISAIEPDGAGLIFEGVIPQLRSPYQVARYDGGLQGTEAAMTYFYTDLVAKAWAFNLGDGIPYQVVEGFIPNPLAKTPWAFCPKKEASGRLWFGLRNEGLDIKQNEINFGGVATRVFTLIESEFGSDQEVEPDYSFGRVIWWWDRHYMEMADYEPQYHRLDQLTRWGAVSAWLLSNPDLPQLPVLPPEDVSRDISFDHWLEANTSKLKWNYDVPFVQPEGENTEALLNLYSEWYEDCGGFWQMSGGISAPGFDEIITLSKERPDLDSLVSRAGLSNIGTHFDDVSGTGEISRVLTRTNTNEAEAIITWDLNIVDDAVRSVEVETVGSKAWRLGDFRTWVSETAPRKISSLFEESRLGIVYKQSVLDYPVGKLHVNTYGHTASVEWEPGIIARARRIIKQLEHQLKSNSLPDAVYHLDNINYIYQPNNTEVYLKISDEWVNIHSIDPNDLPSNDLSIRFGKPGSEDTPPVYYEANIGAKPDINSEWITLNQDQPIKIEQSPNNDARQYIFNDVSGNKGSIYFTKDGVTTKTYDPLFGLEGSYDALIFDPNVITKIENAQTIAQSAGDGYARAILLTDDTLVLVRSDSTILVDIENSRFNEIKNALKYSPESDFKFEVTKDHIAWITELDGPIVYKSPKAVYLDNFLQSNGIDATHYPVRGPPIAIEPILFEETRLIPSAVGLESQIQIVQVPITPEVREEIRLGADVLRWEGKTWHIISRTKPDDGVDEIGADIPPAYELVTFIYIDLSCANGAIESYCATPTP